jgi:ubiquinone/menaquinone biosynthesis C-methylase UbiE
MSSYYTGQRARFYNTRWHTFLQKTLAETMAMIDLAALQHVPERLGRPPRVLDVACGTGLLLKQIIERIPDVEAYGVDGSRDMLAQAQQALHGLPRVGLQQTMVGNSLAALPFEPQSFDLITCTNALHDIEGPVETLTELGRLLTSEGQFVVEDYARHEPPFPWALVEWLVRRIERGHVRAYTLAEAKSLCRQAGLSVVRSQTFPVDWLWHGWVLRSTEASPHMPVAGENV